MSLAVAIVLLLSYAAGLLFSLQTHRDLFNPAHGEDDHGGEPWTVRKRRASRWRSPAWRSA